MTRKRIITQQDRYVGSSAFTIVELLVVIAVIGILATVSILAYSSVQSSSRDSKRSADVSVITEALEKYYDQNGEYPSCSAMVQPSNTVTTNTLKGTDPQVLSTPTSTAGTNSIICSSLASGSGPDSFGYVGDGSSTCSSGAACLQYTLQYREEGTGNIISVQSRRQTQLATTDAPTLSASVAGFTQANLSWSAVSNSLNYQTQRATNSSFTTGLASATTTSTSNSMTGLIAGTTYYFRVQANAASSQSNWSNTVSVTTPQLATPTISTTADSTTQVTVTWGAISMAQTYTLQQSTSSSFTSPTIVAGIVGTSRAMTGLISGETYYYRVQAVATGDTSNWSNTSSVVTPINAPGTPTITASLPNSTTAVGTTGGVSCAAGTIEYSLRYNSTNAAADGAWSSWAIGTSRTQSGAYQGNKYTFQAQARCLGPDIASSYTTSGTNYVITPMTQPSAPTYLSPSQFTDEVYAIVNYASYCPAGTWMVNGTFHTVFTPTGVAYGPHPFGYNDWWNIGSQTSSAIQYWGSYYCTTYYVASSYSPESYNVIYVYH